MRSFYSHLEAIQSVGESLVINQKPTFRSSAIFPVLHNKDTSSKIIFMGYWLLKRHIKEIGLLYTLRSKEGKILSRKYKLIDSAKAFSIQLGEFTNEMNESGTIDNFEGSLELEIFSTQDLVFPYPAFVLVYYSDTYSTAVHTVGRIYNDIEDLSINEEYKVRESGFDIYGNANLSPFVAFTNGPIKNATPKISYEIVNASGKTLKGEFVMKPIQAFETVFIRLKEHIKLNEILGNDEVGTIRIGHNLEGFFPRFAVGNFDDNTKTISITHTFYDSSELNDDKSFWNRKDEQFNDSSVAIPLYITNGFYTRIAIYPIFSPSDFTLSFSFYDEKGVLVKHLPNHHEIKSNDNKYEQIDFKSIVLAENIDIDAVSSVNLICNWNDKTRIPTRVKFGLNIGEEGKEVLLPSNICFAPQLGNPNMLKKKAAFRWAPFVNIGSSEVVLTNSASLKEYNREANVNVTFHREADDSIITRNYVIPANGLESINVIKDEELRLFFDEKSGWMAANSDNPFLYGYYFDFNESGAVAADHIF